jgi:alkanesulfonate monooxygenase SsuD/methylene tetrahydromethanopterin reductase-like flavin-dependent oxidoreductase (luciferase family)
MAILGGTGLVLRDALALPDLREIATTAEETGYGAIFVPEIAGREAFSTLTVLAGATERVTLGTGVVPMDSRGPGVTAMAAATLHDASGGRHVLGMGAGHPPPGTTPPPSQRLREYVRVVRAALAGETVSSELYGLEEFRLELGLERPPPIWLAALGERTVELAAEAADGVLLNWCTPARVGEAKKTIAAAATGAGRDSGAITVAVYVRACVGVPAGVALGALQAMTALYASLPNYRPQFERMGLGEEAGLAAAAFQANRPEEVPGSMVDALCVRGTREAWTERAAAFRAAGADLILCYPVAALDPFSSVLGTTLACAPEPDALR